MPYFIARYVTTGSGRTDVRAEPQPFDSSEAAVEAARRQYRDGEYVIMEEPNAAELGRQAFQDPGSHTDDIPPPSTHETGPLPGGPVPRRPNVLD